MAWRALRLQQDEDLGTLLQCWGWTKARTIAFDEAVFNSKRTKAPLTKAKALQSRPWFRQLPDQDTPAADSDAGATQRLGGYRGRRVGEASNPGPRAKRLFPPLALLSLNIGGRENGWTCMNQVNPRVTPVVCFLNDDDFRAIALAMTRQGWLGYFCKGQSSGRRRTAPIGGCITVVHTGVPCEQFAAHATCGGQVLAVQVGRTVILNMYACHHEDPHDFLCETFAICQALNSDDWVLVGDFNTLPQDSPMVTALTHHGAHLILPPEGTGGSRWNNPRIIDFGLTNMHSVLGWSFLREHWSDHRAWVLTWPEKSLQVGSAWGVVSCNRYFPTDPDNFVKWTQLLAQEWLEWAPGWKTTWSQWNPECSTHDASQVAAEEKLGHAQ